MTRANTFKSDRALELYEKNTPIWIIAERLGVKPRHVQAMLQTARRRREKATEAVQ